MIYTVPAATAVTTPPDVTVASVLSELVQEPPVAVSFNVVWLPVHNVVVVPVIGFTVGVNPMLTMAVSKQVPIE